METYRYGGVWRLFCAAVAFIPLLLGVAMYFNHETLDARVLAILGAFVAAGVVCYAYFATYRITVTPEALTIHELPRRPRIIPWREVTAIRTTSNELMLTTVAQQKVSISSHFPHVEALERAAAHHLPDVAYESPAARPSDVPVPPAIMRAWWTIAARRLLVGGVLLIGLGYGGAVALHHSANPILIYVFAVAKAGGYGGGFVSLFLASLYFVMALQERARMKRRP